MIDKIGIYLHIHKVKLKGVVVEEALFDPLERTYSYSLQLGT